MRHLTLPLLAALSLACAPASGGEDEDDGAADDTGGGGGGGSGPQPAPLAEVSGSCPDLSVSTTTTFESSGIEREVTVVVPDAPSGEMGVVFFFHGLMDPGQTPHPAEYMADGLNMQSMANSLNTVILLPVSQTMSMAGFTFFMWDAAREGDEDLVLYDDLRTCVAQQHDVDLKRLASVGFSGGAMWNTVIIGERSDTLSAAVEASGGSDYTIPLFSEPGTDRLEDHLVEAGHVVVRCDHTYGHTITQGGWNAAIDWATEHVYGEPSPWASDLGDLGTLCRYGGE
jgi:hypothetical protein